MWWMASTAFGAEVRDFTPAEGGRPAVVVVTPGFSLQAFLPLIRGLLKDGHEVHTIEFACQGQTRRELEAELLEAVQALPPGQTLVAHGLGATLALGAAPSVDRYVLLAPVLDIQPVAATGWLASLPTSSTVDLSQPLAWNGFPVADLLLGDPVPLTCASGPWVRELQADVLRGSIELSLERVEQDVWLGVSLGDEVAQIEAVIPASRHLPHRTVSRLGLNALHGRDFSHGAMLTHRIPIRAAMKALRKPR